jgi:hypothetical protein
MYALVQETDDWLGTYHFPQCCVKWREVMELWTLYELQRYNFCELEMLSVVSFLKSYITNLGGC